MSCLKPEENSTEEESMQGPILWERPESNIGIALPFILHWLELSCKAASNRRHGGNCSSSAYKGSKGNEHSELLANLCHTYGRKRKES